MLKRHTTTEFIAKEGWKSIALFSSFFLISLIVGFLPWVFLFLWLILFYIYRNPERIPAEDDRMALLAPVDGRIVDISKVRLKDEREFLKVEIRKTLLDVSLLRSPVSLHISNTKRVNGLFMNVSNPISKKIGQKSILTCKSKFADIVMIVYVGFWSKNLELFKSIGPLKFAQRFGFLLDGSIELFLPVKTRIKVSLNDRVKAGESVLGYFAYEIDDYE